MTAHPADLGTLIRSPLPRRRIVPEIWLLVLFHTRTVTNMTTSDPLAPASRRFPRDKTGPTDSAAQPSAARPFVLRGRRPSTPVTARHRTSAHQTPITNPTTSDGKNPTTKPDTYTTPDT